jgi:hypothetical protein
MTGLSTRARLSSPEIFGLGPRLVKARFSVASKPEATRGSPAHSQTTKGSSCYLLLDIKVCHLGEPKLINCGKIVVHPNVVVCLLRSLFHVRPKARTAKAIIGRA